MTHLRKLLWAAILAGLVAGLFSALLVEWRLAPLIAEAERFESFSSSSHTHVSDEPAAPEGIARGLLTALSTVLAVIGFAFLLGGGTHLANVPVTLKSAAFLGLGASWSFHLAPALILAPELPGMAATAVTGRQVIWVLTALATASGLLVVAKARNWPARCAGAVLALSPLLFPVLRPSETGTVPPELASAFAANSIAVSVLTFLVLSFAYALALERGKS